MSMGVAIFLVVGLPLILLCGGFFVLMLYIFKGRDKSAQQSQTLILAQQLERTLSKIESRLGALEDIILSPAAKGGDNERENL